MKKIISILGVFVFIALFTKCKVSTSPEQKLPKYVEISFAPGEAPANRYYLLVLFKGEIAEEEAIAFSPVYLSSSRNIVKFLLGTTLNGVGPVFSGEDSYYAGLSISTRSYREPDFESSIEAYYESTIKISTSAEINSVSISDFTQVGP